MVVDALLVVADAFRPWAEAGHHLVSYPEDVVVAHLQAAYQADVEEARQLAAFHRDVVVSFYQVSYLVLVKGHHLFFAHQGRLFQLQASGPCEEPFAAMHVV